MTFDDGGNPGLLGRNVYYTKANYLIVALNVHPQMLKTRFDCNGAQGGDQSVLHSDKYPASTSFACDGTISVFAVNTIA